MTARQIDQSQYYGTIPNIAQAFQNDPRSKLAASALALGTSTTPVAGGSWAVPDGLARAAQAMLGAYMNKQQEEKYAAREKGYSKDMRNVAQLASTPQPGTPAAAPAGTTAPASPFAGAAAALSGTAPTPPGVPLRQIDPDAAMWPQNGPSQGQGALGATPPPSGTGLPLTPPSMDASLAPRAPIEPPPGPPQFVPRPSPMGSTTPGGMLSPEEYYRRGIRPIEGGTDPKTGAFRTSPKGAIGPGQIMPGTAPEAAKLAGLPYNERLYKTDAAYNDALGVAYYGKQLADFGDPLKAAAAYNAGPNRVRRAIRRGGENYAQFLPEETRKYLVNFAGKIGDAATAGAPQAAQQVAPPTMEAVPNGPPTPSVQVPFAPQRPTEVQSNRIAMAQKLMASGNPDLMVIAQSYLDKGLDEQNAARTLMSQQEFQQGQTGYQANLNNWQNANSDYRQDAYGQRRDAQSRNFTRETGAVDRQFRADQAAAERAQQTSERQAGQQYDFARNVYNNQFQAGENDKNRTNKLDVAGQRQQQAANRNAYFSTATGLKMQKEAGDTINRNAQTITSLERFMDLNEGQRSGGVLGALGITGAYGAVNDAIAEMKSISSNTTLSALGGSLGTAISDGDRKFIAGANVSTDNKRGANDNIARAVIGAKRRENDYLTEFSNAQADGTAPQFARDWALFAKSVPIVQYGKDGNAIATDKPLTFTEWKASRPKYDATGKRIK